MTGRPQRNQREHRELFLHTLFDEVPGKIEVRSFPLNGGAPRQTFCTTIPEALDAVDRDCAAGCNVYLGMATRGSRVSDQTGRLSGGKDNLVAVRALWVDRDGLTEEGAREAYAIDLEQFPHRPSLRVDSGGGEHSYWLLEEPWLLDSPERIQALEHTLRGLADVLHADPASTDAARILRVPGTFNLPTPEKLAAGRVMAKCRIEDIDGRLYQAEVFEDFRSRGALLRRPTTASTVSLQKFQHPHRHEALTRHVAFLRKSGLSVDAAKAALLVFNAQRCEPPKEDDEVIAIARWSGRVDPEKGSSREATSNKGNGASPPNGVGDLVEALAQLTPVEYDQRREKAAGQLGIRLSTLDSEVNA